MTKLPTDSINDLESILNDAYTQRVSNLEQSIVLANKALTLSKKAGNKLYIGKSLNMIALFYMIQGEFDKCIGLSKKAIEYFEELNDESGIADAKYNIAGVYYRTDDYHRSLMYLIGCRATYKKYNDYLSLSKVEKTLGTIYEYLGDQKNALKSYNNAVEAAQQANDLNFESNAYNPLSGIYLKNGKIDLAMETITKSIAMKEQTGDLRGYAFAIYGRGKVYTHLKEFEKAEQDYLEAIKIHQQVSDRLGVGMAKYKLGILYVQKGDVEKGKTVFLEGLEHSTTYNIVIVKIKCYYQLYLVYKDENDYETAIHYLEKYQKEKESVINTQVLKVIENYQLISKVEALENEARIQREKADIIEKKNRAEEAARVRQEFLSNMSHEIRTPLNAVIMITSLLGEGTNAEERQMIESLKFASNNLLRIINDILDFTKLDLSKTQLEFAPVKLKSFVESIRLTYENLAKEKGIWLKADIANDIDEYYEMDDTRMSQILGNLISNAIKFTDIGGVDIKIYKLQSTATTDVLKFEISDTGAGIAKSSYAEVFESFSQPKQITTKKHGGSGLGLAIVKKLVELHNSAIHLDSEVGKGSNFYFVLELKKADAPEVKAESPTMNLEGKTVLLVEDNKVNAMVATKLLSIWGMQIEWATNGFEAIEKASQKPYNFILMDIHMPEKNGYDATIEIRQKKGINANTPIFALTADATINDQKQYINYFNGILRKPIEISKLYAALSKFVVA